MLEKVSADKSSAVGKCARKAPLGGPCTVSEACAEGECQWKDPAVKEGVCAGGR